LIPEQEDGGRGLDGAVGGEVCHESMMIVPSGWWQAPRGLILQADCLCSAPLSAVASDRGSSRSRR
jgi:hypothetical protein